MTSDRLKFLEISSSDKTRVPTKLKFPERRAPTTSSAENVKFLRKSFFLRALLLLHAVLLVAFLGELGAGASCAVVSALCPAVEVRRLAILALPVVSARPGPSARSVRASKKHLQGGLGRGTVRIPSSRHRSKAIPCTRSKAERTSREPERTSSQNGLDRTRKMFTDVYRFLPICRTFLGDFNLQKLPSRRLQTLWEWKNRVILEKYYILNVVIPLEVE